MRGNYIVVLFFFFKQKTAYEMRISDWSSDVCSSDLPGEQASAFGAVSNAIGDYSTSVSTQSAATGTSSVALGGPIDLIPGLGFFIDTQASGEIGRAPCRERGCQYV